MILCFSKRKPYGSNVILPRMGRGATLCWRVASAPLVLYVFMSDGFHVFVLCLRPFLERPFCAARAMLPFIQFTLKNMFLSIFQRSIV